MTCPSCIAHRLWLRSHGLSWWRTWRRQCWTHTMQRRAHLHIAGQLALLLVCAMFVVGGFGLLIQIVKLVLDGGP